MAESPKHFFSKVLKRGPYFEVLNLMDNNPDWRVEGSVGSISSHYVHAQSTQVSLEMDGALEDAVEEERAGRVVDALQTELQGEVVDWNKELTAELYAELENMQSDETLVRWMDEVDWHFDEEGHVVDLSDYKPISELEPEVRDRVLREYADLFDRTPEQVFQALLQRQVPFDARGRRVDTSAFKKIGELDPAVRQRVLDKYRDLMVEDQTWVEPIEEKWKEKLGALGFDRIEIRYSLGYNQGDGASFTADSIDVRKLCECMLRGQQTQAEAKLVVADVLG